MSKSTIDVSGFAAGTHISSIAISLYIFNLSMYVNTGYSKWIVPILNSYCGSFWYCIKYALNNFHGKKWVFFDSFQNRLK